MFDLLRKSQWAAVDCLTGESFIVEHLPFEIGSGHGADLRLASQGVAERHCAINQIKGQGLCLIKHDPNGVLTVNGSPVDIQPLGSEGELAVKIGAHFVLLRGGRNPEDWIQGIDCAQWTLRDGLTNQVDGPASFGELIKAARENGRHPQSLVQPAGVTQGFLLEDALDVEASLAALARAEPAMEALSDLTEAEPRVLTCPVCWLKFDLGDLMHLAAHDSLRGDPVLGEDAPQRFLATRFNDLGQALDAFGLPCTEIACPHCRRVLPPGFTEMPHHIISIVGDQSAGKSYYLSVLMKMLPTKLYENFNIVFQDADPAGNALLTEMKQTLFGAESPEKARLAKTQLEGGMYVSLPRYGRMVKLPKPFVYSAASPSQPSARCSVIFYDNAGEHFQPGRDSVESPGAQHVASSAGILFLFDPFNNPDFRHMISDRDDPQLEKPALDLQGVILSEMKVRISKLLKLELLDQIHTPLAVVIGKCDSWIHLLEGTPLHEPIAGGALDLSAVKSNSDHVRGLMKRIAPQIVANAESISSRVMFFPASSFGHSPVRLGPGDFVPDPKQLKPFQVETPILWLLSCIEPGLVPSQ